MTQEERRADERRRPNPGCYVLYIEGTGSVRDLSVSGAFILDEQPLPVGERVKFSLRDGSFDITLQGMVTRSEYRAGMAVRFTGLSKEDIRRLKVYMTTLGPQDGAVPKPQRLTKIRERTLS